MKIKTILGIIFVLAFLAGCSGPIYTGDQCVDDGVCTLREKYLGNCFDCFPDFEVTEDQAFAYLDGNNLHANVCVRNKVNEYKGDVKIRWTLHESNGFQHFEGEEYVYFDSDDAWGYFSLNVDPGKINFHTFLEIGQNEQWQCFRRNFEVDPSAEYIVGFNINPYEEVDEQDYFNNRISFIVEGELDLSEYLILDNIGFFSLVYSNVDTVEDFISNTYYKFKSYEAHYRNRDFNSVDVMVAANFESGDAYSLLFDVLEMLEFEENYYFNETNVNNGVVYIGENDQMAMWVYANRLIMVHSENILENDVFLEYINQFPSDFEYIDYECEDFDCPEGYFSEIIGYDEFNCPIFDCVEPQISLSIDLEESFAIEIEGKYRLIKFINASEEFGVFQIGTEYAEEIEDIILSEGQEENVLGISVYLKNLFVSNIGCDNNEEINLTLELKLDDGRILLLNLGEEKFINHNGNSYILELISFNSYDEIAIISVNGFINNIKLDYTEIIDDLELTFINYELIGFINSSFICQATAELIINDGN